MNSKKNSEFAELRPKMYSLVIVCNEKLKKEK